MEWPLFEAENLVDAILAAAWDVADQPAKAPWGERLGSTDPAVRFWAVHGIGWGAARVGADFAASASRIAQASSAVSTGTGKK